MIFGHLRHRARSMVDGAVRLAAPKGRLTIDTIPPGTHGQPPKMPPPLSPAYAALSIDIARARLAAQLLTMRKRRLTAPLMLPRVFLYYLRLAQATTLANAIAASAAAQELEARERRGDLPVRPQAEPRASKADGHNRPLVDPK
jgi:hypothetical protein